MKTTNTAAYAAVAAKISGRLAFVAIPSQDAKRITNTVRMAMVTSIRVRCDTQSTQIAPTRKIRAIPMVRAVTAVRVYFSLVMLNLDSPDGCACC